MSTGTRLPPAARASVPVVVVGAAMLSCIGVCVGYPCFSTGLRYGIWVDQCPATDLRLDVNVQALGILRGDPEAGQIVVSPTASWLDGKGRSAYRSSAEMRRGYSIVAELRDEAGTPVEGAEFGRWDSIGDARAAHLDIPAVPDGDYILHVAVDAGFESAEVEVDLPLYAPAVVHLMTDRPLYRPGQEVLLRSVALKRTDLTSLDGRPGRWRITDPRGEQMLVEKDRAGPWGIADGSFPLDTRAEIGTWRATWETGGTSDTVTFDVRPFRLPRVSVEAKAAATWFAIGDRLVVEGRATYTSGAPIGDAPVAVDLSRIEGRWPMPLEWEDTKRVQTAADGTFEADFGPVPPDLIERATLFARVAVTEAAGETASGSAALVLSKDDLKVEAVTELGDGLVGGFNNRAYLRVSAPDGRPLAKTAITVSNPYDPMEPGKPGETDEDGVMAIQLDPGDPVTVIEPAPPVRPRPLVPDPPMLLNATVVGQGRGLTLDERRSVDRLHGAIAACGLYAVGNQDRDVGVHVDRNGSVRRVMSGDDPAARCVANAHSGLRLPAGTDRTLTLRWRVPDAKRPHLQLSHTEAWQSEPQVRITLDAAALKARTCLQAGRGSSGADVADVHWQVTEGSRSVQTTISRGPVSGLSPTALGCVTSTLAAVTLDKPAERDAMGLTRARLSVPQAPGQVAPQPRALTAYELKISASDRDQPIGETRLVLPVGSIPHLRLRATPSLAAPGETVTVDLLRGPSFSGTLPEELQLMAGTREVAEADVEEKKATFTIPDDVDGFLHVEWAGARAVVYAQRPDRLQVTLGTDDDSYRPGSTAQLTVTTTAGDGPVPAGVGLVGVDNALGQLAPLLDPDDYGRVTVRATSDHPAFDAFDPRALSLGQVRGDDAARAAVMRITHLPMDPAGDEAVTTAAGVQADTLAATTASFYRALEHSIAAVRSWEHGAAAGEQMDPERMVTVWNTALADLAADGEPAIDGYGRTLTLDVLPEDLLAQVDPRQVVADGTRLPEDVVSWTRYVEQEVVR